MRLQKKILVADDEGHIRELLKTILELAGYEVILAEDGETAVEKALTEQPDVVITDGLMPKMHGFLVCKALKELQYPPRVIVLTGVYKKAGYEREVRYDYGADDFLSKPFDLLEILNRVQYQLGDSGTGAASFQESELCAVIREACGLPAVS